RIDAAPVQGDRGVGAGMREVADRIRLDRDLGQLPARARAVVAEAVGRAREIDVGAGSGAEIEAIEAEAPFVGGEGRRDVVPSERGRTDRGLRGPARMHALGPRTVFEEL